jgi:fibronectin-binding autotransporter adhesin
VTPHLNPLSGPSLVDLPAPLTGLGSLNAYATTANARSAANVLDQILANDPTDPAASTLTPAQTQLIVTATSLNPSQKSQFLTEADGQIHAAMVAVAPEAGQQMAGSVYDHLGDVSSEPSTGPLVWGNASTEFGERGSNSTAEGFTSDVTQFVVGADLLSQGTARLGVGYAYTMDNVSEGTGNGTAHENAGFVYGQLPVGRFVVDGIGSYGATSTDTQRADPLGGTLLQANGVSGGDALVSLGISRPFTIRNVTLAPYGRVTWQQVSEASYSEGSSSAASLSVDSFAGTGVRSMIGLTAGSAATSPLAAPATYRFDLGVGEDAGNLLNPTLRANLAGISMTIASPQVTSTFVQASVSGTLRLSPSAYLYGQLFGEARGNETLGGISGGVRIRF